MAMSAGVTRSNTGIDNTVWNILGQIYVPKQLSERSMSWHATLPVGTFVPPHIHPAQQFPPCHPATDQTDPLEHK